MRRTLLGIAAAAVMAGLAGSADARTLQFQATWPAGSTLYDNFVMWAERVKALTGGELEVKTMPAGQVVPAFEVFDAINAGVLDGGHAWSGYLQGRHPAAILFTGGPGGPFGLDMIDHMGWYYEGGGKELYEEFWKNEIRLNIHAIPVLPAGPQAFGWFKAPIASLEDMKGMKCRQTGIANEIWSRMGFSVVNMPGGEILPAAERGVIDCAEWVGGVEDLRLGFHNVWKYHFAPGMHETVTIADVLVNGDVWESLTEEQRQIFESAATETWLRWWIRWQKDNAAALKELREKYGVIIKRTPEDVLKAFLKAWDDLAAEHANNNPFFKKVLESKREYASVVVPAKRFYFPPYSFAADIYWPPEEQ
ncbi:Monocarboxylate 2-oxoacid-binding periplasmic protein [bacterium HR39]|nr:Monocarboxylate 2-oxoacid-binding periplasmic protein [bacterium HR39]